MGDLIHAEDRFGKAERWDRRRQGEALKFRENFDDPTDVYPVCPPCPLDPDDTDEKPCA